jgi:hypothetical protein
LIPASPWTSKEEKPYSLPDFAALHVLTALDFLGSRYQLSTALNHLPHPSVELYATNPAAIERLAQHKWSKRAQPAPVI